MIENARLLHYLDEHTYRMVCGKFGLDPQPSKIGDNLREFPGEPISRLHLFNIDYRDFGHIWFLHMDVCFPLFQCDPEEFGDRLYRAYEPFFSPEIASRLPVYEALNCDYIEYTGRIVPGDAGVSLRQLAGAKCAPEQLDAALWERYVKPHSTIAFYADQGADGTIRCLAKCHGTALKRLIREETLHRATGIVPTAAFSESTARMVLAKQLEKFSHADVLAGCALEL